MRKALLFASLLLASCAPVQQVARETVQETGTRLEWFDAILRVWNMEDGVLEDPVIYLRGTVQLDGLKCTPIRSGTQCDLPNIPGNSVLTWKLASRPEFGALSFYRGGFLRNEALR